MTEEKIVYGIAPLKKGQRYATAIEAVNANQVRHYRLYKIDSKMLQNKQTKQTRKQVSNNVILQVAALTGELTKIQKEITQAKTKKKRSLLEKQLKMKQQEYSNIVSQLKR